MTLIVSFLHATSLKGYVESVQVAKRHKYLKEVGWADGGRVIACTQPRRLAVQPSTICSPLPEAFALGLVNPLARALRKVDLVTCHVPEHPLSNNLVLHVLQWMFPTENETPVSLRNQEVAVGVALEEKVYKNHIPAAVTWLMLAEMLLACDREKPYQMS
ncbi:hypothetical protein Tco_0780610 [Tanacetum coccineum]